MRAQRSVSCLGLLFLGVMACTWLLEGDADAQPATPATIRQINDDLPSWVGVTVEVDGVWIADADRVELWVSADAAGMKTTVNWPMRLKITDGGAMPPDPTGHLLATVRVQGVVSAVGDTAALVGPQQVGSIAIAFFAVLTPPPPAPPSVGMQMPSEAAPAGPCDYCHFVLIACGFNEIAFWNDVLQKYEYKRNTANICHDNIVVLYGPSGSRDVTKIPNGTVVGGNFTNGGAYVCSQANVGKAFDYIQAKMNSVKGSCPPSKMKFQFHSTGHGGGYHTQSLQTSQPGGDGYAGGRLDFSGDEKQKINEGDLAFRWEGTYHLDENNRKDLQVRLVNGKREVRRDVDENGTFETLVGTDTNGDGRVDKRDSDWVPQDWNRDGSIGDVAFDQVLCLGGDDVLTDDWLKGWLAALQASAGLGRENTRVELAQCFSGGFIEDLASVASEVATECEHREYSYYDPKLGYSPYQYGFVNGLAAGMSFDQRQLEFPADDN